MNDRITIPEIATRLSLGRAAVYQMLERGVIPAIRIGKCWLVTRYAFDKWERSCGTTAAKRAQRASTSPPNRVMN
jgi:excisionase family DNA binding protein